LSILAAEVCDPQRYRRIARPETKSVATIRRRMVAIAQAHKDAGAPNPVAHRDVQKVLAGIVRTKTVAQKRKDALTKDRLEEAVKALGPI
jgi:hypothetical protein